MPVFLRLGERMASVYCGNCGSGLAAGSAVCQRCDTPSPAAYPPPSSPMPPQSFPAVGVPQASWTSPRPMVGFGEAIRLFFANYANFHGRTRRSEFWFAQLFLSLVGLVFQVFLFFPSIEMQIIFLVLALAWFFATIVPSLAVASRRLHDTDTSFGYYFLSLIPLVGAILVIVKLATDGSPGPNRFGHSPKYSA
jgi:uncharacterized membrane protein YhaH (DUF805 family)